MAIFKTADEKAAAQAEKEQKLLEKYGLEGLSSKDAQSVRTIINELAGTGMMDAGMKLSFGGKTEDILKVSYLRAILEQNWIIIRLLNEISNK